MNCAEGSRRESVPSKAKGLDTSLPLREPFRPQFVPWPLSFRQVRAFRLGCAAGATLSLLLALLILGSGSGRLLGQKRPFRAAPEKLSRLPQRLRLSHKLQTRLSFNQAALTTQEASADHDASKSTLSHWKESPSAKKTTQGLGVHPALSTFLFLASAEEAKASQISRAAAATMRKVRSAAANCRRYIVPWFPS